MKYFLILFIALVLSSVFIVIKNNTQQAYLPPRPEYLYFSTAGDLSIPDDDHFLRRVKYKSGSDSVVSKYFERDSIISKYYETVFDDSCVLISEEEKDDLFLEMTLYPVGKEPTVLIGDSLFRIKDDTGPVFLRTGVEDDKIRITKKGLRIFSTYLYQKIKKNYRNRKKKTVVVFDISELSSKNISDKLKTPVLNSLNSMSKSFIRSYPLSTERTISLRSFLECLSPYKFNDGKEPYRELKRMVRDSLRRSSLPQVYSSEGYNTKLFTSRTDVFYSFADMFDEGISFDDVPSVIGGLYSSLVNGSAKEEFYFVDLFTKERDDNYLSGIDVMLKEFFDKLDGLELTENILFLFVSTRSEKPYGNTLSFFHLINNLEASRDTSDVALTDIAKTLMKYSGVRIPYYLSGYDLEEKEDDFEREYFAGSRGDTLLLFNSSKVYKQVKYTYEYKFYDLEAGLDITEEHTGIDEKYSDIIPRYFGGDYIKFIELSNNTDEMRKFVLRLSSRRRFAEINELGKYYDIKKERYRYRESYSAELEPGSKDTLMIYYGSLYQKFHYEISPRSSISYGGTGINAGDLTGFDENSYYGMRYCDTGGSYFKDHDIRIYNSRINY